MLIIAKHPVHSYFVVELNFLRLIWIELVQNVGVLLNDCFAEVQEGPFHKLKQYILSLSKQEDVGACSIR